MQNRPSPFRLLSVLALLIAPWAYGQTASTTALSLSATSVPHGMAVTLSAFVEANGSPVAPGLVTFTDGKTVCEHGSAVVEPFAVNVSTFAHNVSRSGVLIRIYCEQNSALFSS